MAFYLCLLMFKFLNYLGKNIEFNAIKYYLYHILDAISLNFLMPCFLTGLLAWNIQNTQQNSKLYIIWWLFLF